MKNSGVEWIGEIPDDWEVKKIFWLINFINGYAFDGSSLSLDLDIPVIRIGNISDNKIDYESCLLYKDDKTLEQYSPSEGDILIAMSGATTGKIGIATNRKAYINQRVGIIRSTYNFLLKYYFQISAFDEYIKLLSAGSAQPNISMMQIQDFKIPFPPKETQQKIATYLDSKCSKIEETIQNQQQVIEKLKAYKQSLITEAVTGKIKIQNGKACGKYDEYKDSGVEWIGEIPSGWECKRLKFIVNSFKKGNGITKDEVFVDGDTPCVRYGELYTKYNYSFTECFSKTRKDLLQTLQYFSYGDILFTCTGELIEEIGKNTVYLGNEKCLAGGDLIIASHFQNPSFLSYALNSNYAQTQKSMGKAKLKVVHISAREIGNILTILPPIEEQERIANFLDKQCIAIESSIGKKQNLIEKLTEYKKSLIYECVTGKKEV